MRLFLPLVLALLFACGGPPEPPPTEPLSLVMITIDTLRADHLRSYGYFRETSPVIDSFAEDALLFENTISPISTTLPAHLSIFTSTYPSRHGILANFKSFHEQAVVTDDSLQTAAQMLRGAGYRTAAFTSSSTLHQETGIGAGFDHFVGLPTLPLYEKGSGVLAEHTINAALHWLEQVEPPFFLWVHLFDPHAKYAPPEPYDQAFTSNQQLAEFLKRRGMSWAVAPQHNQYDGEILYADTQVGRLLHDLRQRGFYDRAVIVLTSDHGEGLSQHGHPEHGDLWNEQLWVPLILRLPNGPRGRDARLASLIDILPTLAEETDLPLQRKQFDGHNLLREERNNVFSQRKTGEREKEPGFAITGLRWKYIHFSEHPDLLFDRETDPHELTNVVTRHPERSAVLQEQIRQQVARDRSRSPLATGELSGELKQQIKALGYVE